MKNKEPIVHYGEYGLCRKCVEWPYKSDKYSILEKEVTCKRCRNIMGWK